MKWVERTATYSELTAADFSTVGSRVVDPATPALISITAKWDDLGHITVRARNVRARPAHLCQRLERRPPPRELNSCWLAGVRPATVGERRRIHLSHPHQGVSDPPSGPRGLVMASPHPHDIDRRGVGPRRPCLLPCDVIPGWMKRSWESLLDRSWRALVGCHSLLCWHYPHP